MRNFFSFTLALLFVTLGFLFSPLELHAAPAKIAHQGRLLNAQSKPITAPVSVDFAIYPVTTGGAPVWTETQLIAPDALGFYKTFLGNVNPLPLSLPEPGYLQLTINSETLKPRGD